jgi:putative hydrolase of the HAD superfamily
VTQVISCILLDYGGTLDSDGIHWLDRFYAIYERLDTAIPARQLIKDTFYAADEELERDPTIRACGLRELVRRHVMVQFRMLKIADPALEAQTARAFVEPAERLLQRNRGVLATIERCGCRLGVVSNFYGNLLTICDEAGLTPHLDILLDSAIVGLRKPDPRFFALALERLGRAATEAVFVGDSLDRDIRPAKALGMKTVWLRDDLEAPSTEAGLVDRAIGSLTDLPATISDWRARGSHS